MEEYCFIQHRYECIVTNNRSTLDDIYIVYMYLFQIWKNFLCLTPVRSVFLLKKSTGTFLFLYERSVVASIPHMEKSLFV